MVRTVKNHHHEEEENDDEDFISKTTDSSSQKDERKKDQKASSHRSKHSETEQRRRSKINERFQFLRDLIPQNDQKRDRASFLLEVIQYIQFLQEKLQVYEGTYQGWSHEPTKLIPWRGNCSADNIVEPDLSVSTFFKTTDRDADVAVSVDEPLQKNTFEAEADVELLASQPQPQTWNDITFLSEAAIQSCTPLELEESSFSNAYSKGLLNNLTQELGSSGVDLSLATISVQFDIRKKTSSVGIKDDDFLSPGNQATTHCGFRSGNDARDQAHKRPRTEQNQ